MVSMPPSSQRYVIWGAARTGTSWVTDLVSRHPEVHDFHEFLHDAAVPEPDSYAILSKNMVPAWKRVLRPGRARTTYLDNILRPTVEHPVVGGKILNIDVVWPFKLTRRIAFRHVVKVKPQLHRWLLMGAIQHWLEQNDVLVIVVVRENLLKTYVSEKLAAQSGKYWSTQGERTQNAVRLETAGAKGVLNELRRLERQHEAVLAYGRRFRHIVCVYESGEEAIGRQVDDALGLRPQGLREQKFTKQSPDDLRQSIVNYEEVATTLKGSPFERFLD
jgi:LPS sulfotransferase NodH